MTRWVAVRRTTAAGIPGRPESAPDSMLMTSPGARAASWSALSRFSALTAASSRSVDAQGEVVAPRKYDGVVPVRGPSPLWGRQGVRQPSALLSTSGGRVMRSTRRAAFIVSAAGALCTGVGSGTAAAAPAEQGTCGSQGRPASSGTRSADWDAGAGTVSGRPVSGWTGTSARDSLVAGSAAGVSRWCVARAWVLTLDPVRSPDCACSLIDRPNSACEGTTAGSGDSTVTSGISAASSEVLMSELDTSAESGTSNGVTASITPATRSCATSGRTPAAPAAVTLARATPRPAAAWVLRLRDRSLAVAVASNADMASLLSRNRPRGDLRLRHRRRCPTREPPEPQAPLRSQESLLITKVPLLPLLVLVTGTPLEGAELRRGTADTRAPHRRWTWFSSPLRGRGV